MPRAYIFLNGDFEKPRQNWPEAPAADDLVIAADGGGRHAATLGWPVHCLVGDFDSLAPELLAGYQQTGTYVEVHPADKDEIDFELALALARRRNFRNLEVLGALGGRWDMSLGNLFLPRADDWDGLHVRFRHGPWSIMTVPGPAELTLSGQPGDLLSLLPLGQDVRGATLRGGRYPLAGETLRAGLSRGLSNRFEQAEVSLSFASGTLMIMQRAGEDDG
jgi:thiamine pyrophosphokinase